MAENPVDDQRGIGLINHVQLVGAPGHQQQRTLRMGLREQGPSRIARPERFARVRACVFLSACCCHWVRSVYPPNRKNSGKPACHVLLRCARARTFSCQRFGPPAALARGDAVDAAARRDGARLAYADDGRRDKH